MRNLSVLFFSNPRICNLHYHLRAVRHIAKWPFSEFEKRNDNENFGILILFPMLCIRF